MSAGVRHIRYVAHGMCIGRVDRGVHQTGGATTGQLRFRYPTATALLVRAGVCMLPGSRMGESAWSEAWLRLGCLTLTELELWRCELFCSTAAVLCVGQRTGPK